MKLCTGISHFEKRILSRNFHLSERVEQLSCLALSMKGGKDVIMETTVRTMETEVVEMLQQAGINSEPVTVIKNGCQCTGIRVINPASPINPVVYYSQEDTVQMVIDKVMAVQRAGTPDIHIDDVTDSEYVASHVFMTIQKCGNEVDVLRKPYLNLELVLRIPMTIGNQTGSIKVTTAFLERTGISEERIWQLAKNNMCCGWFKIFNIIEMLGLPEYMSEDLSMYVCTTEDRNYGATALAFPSVFRDFCVHHNVQSLVLIPSSTEEILILPEEEISGDVSKMPLMVKEINEATVDPLIQLESCVYRFSMETNSVSLLAKVEEMEGENE